MRKSPLVTLSNGTRRPAPCEPPPSSRCCA